MARLQNCPSAAAPRAPTARAARAVPRRNLSVIRIKLYKHIRGFRDRISALGQREDVISSRRV